MENLACNPCSLLFSVVGNHVSFWPQSSIRPKECTKKKRKNRDVFSERKIQGFVNGLFADGDLSHLTDVNSR
jgi:hypothetical protein